MPTRYTRNAAVLAKIESAYGTDSVPTGGANALLISNLQVTRLEADNVDRDLIRPYFGGSEQLVGVARVRATFDVEIAGAGAADTAPAYGPLLRACGFAETITGGSRVEYLPVSSGFEALSLYLHGDGVRTIALGARGTFEIQMGLGERPVFRFTFVGIEGGTTAQTLPSVTLTAFQRPLVVNDANAGDVTLGATYSAGALSGGTSYPSRGLHLNVGGGVEHFALLGGESVEITDRQVTGSVEFDLSAAQEVTLYGSTKANTTQSLGFQLGATEGGIVVLHAPVVQLINYREIDVNGKRLEAFDLRLVPSSGNDELRICVR